MATNTNVAFTDYQTIVSAQWLNYVNNVVNSLGVINISSLRTLVLPTTGNHAPMIYVQGYYAPGDGGGGLYYLNLTDTTSADNGGSIIVGADGSRYYLAGPADWYVEQFGAKGDGATHDEAAIQNAINALPPGGGTVRMRGKTYALGPSLGTNILQIGNGNAGSTNSTKNAIKFIGQGSGTGIGSAVTLLQIIDNGATSAYINQVISVNGAVDSVHLEGFKIYMAGANSGSGGSLANIGIFATSFTACVMRNIQIVHAQDVGLWIQGGTAPTGNYNIYNQFHQIGAISFVNGHTGLLMDGDYPLSNDTWLSSFFNCRFDTFTAINANAAQFKFMDSCSFYRCHFVGNNTGGIGLSGCFGIYWNAVGNAGFPSGCGLYDCSILSQFVNENGTDKIRAQTFVNLGTYDNEQIPTHPMLKGITDQGHPFNGWGT